MNISRRFFIGGLTSAAALGPRGLFAAEPGVFTDGKPKLAFGVLSDVHIALAKGGRKQTPSRNTKYLEKALVHFRDNGVHAVVIAGDITNDGVFGELKAVADAWYRVFPNDKAPDGRKVERIFVFGNHDWSGIRRAEGFRFAASDKRVQAPAKCRIALDRLASGEVPFSVVAYSTWGKASEPLNGTFGAFF